ncbi:hypothetical protein BYT27DRAFT_7283765 [Phlegmacium glaucopus]|nr:hypothetical protein BYT27DRAFT_7283765 [Phlegmacium glaucopus]
MTTAADHRSLEEATKRYLLELDFGIPEIEAVMSKVFSESHSGIEATAWTVYWQDLNIYEENLRDNMSDAGIAPKMPDRLDRTSQSVDPDSMEIDNPLPFHDDLMQLSAQLLQTGAAN